MPKKLIESPSGWWVSVRNEKDGIIELSVNCHHFDNNTLFFEAEQNKEVIAEKDTVVQTEVSQEVNKKEATKRQLFALHCITNANTRNWKLSNAAASKLISLSRAGASREQVLAEAQAMGMPM